MLTLKWNPRQGAYAGSDGLIYSAQEAVTLRVMVNRTQIIGGPLAKEPVRLEPSPQVDSRRPSIPARVRREVFTRDNARCVDCGSQERLEYDHIIPLSKGGANTARNIQLRCEVCNRRKGAKI